MRVFFQSLQELRSLEADLEDKQREQRMTEERLRRRERELAEREIDLLQRELNMMIMQQAAAAAGTKGGGGGPAAAAAGTGSGGATAAVAGTPTPKKRRGHFKRSKLKLLKKDGSRGESDNVDGVSSTIISGPSGEFVGFIVCKW